MPLATAVTLGVSSDDRETPEGSDPFGPNLTSAEPRVSDSRPQCREAGPEPVIIDGLEIRRVRDIPTQSAQWPHPY